MALDARTLRERRKQRIAARMAVAQETDEEMPEWLEEKIEEEGGPGTDVGEPGVDEDVEQATAEDGAEDAAEEEQEENLEELAEDIDELSEDLEEMNEDEAAQDALEEKDEGEAAALGAFNYNPVYQKPTHMGDDKLGGGYHYYGPPPDAGTSYGYYADASSGLRLIAPLSKQVFSPVSGKQMKYEGKVDIEGLASVLALADQMTKVSLASGEERMTSAPLGEHETPKVFDALTGNDISDDVATMRAENEADELMEGMEEVQMPADLGEGEEEMAQDEEEEALPEMDDAEVEQQVDELMAMDEMVYSEEPVEEEEVEELAQDEDELDEEEESEAVKYEALQELEQFEEEPLTEADVHMTLFDDQDEHGRVQANPYWNVDIKGQPVARVYLQDQPKPEEIREVFCSADYHKGVAGAIEKVGLRPVFKQIKAQLWANRLHETKFAQQVKAEVEAAAQQRVVATTRNLLKNLLERVAIVCAGMDKNFYRDEGNALKEALWGELHSFGITNPSPIIEAAFRKGSTRYFETVLNKAVEYMEMEPKALAQVRKAIGEADVLAPGDSTTGDELPDATPASPEEMPTLSDRLAASSVALGGIPAIMGDALGDHKQALRNELRLGGAGPLFKK
jgi:hypothetical protein